MRRSLIGVLCVLVLAGCGGTGAAGAGGATPGEGADATGTTAAPTDGGAGAAAGTAGARRAAKQLEVTSIPGTGGGPYEGRELDPPLVAPAFTLTDTTGEPFDVVRDATGPVTLLYFGYTSCPDVCPTHMAAISKALSDLPDDVAAQVQVIFVSVDTVNDDPGQLRDYLDAFDTDFVGLTGTADQVNAALRTIGLPPTAIASADEFPPRHPSDVLAYTADHRAHVSFPFGTAPSAFAADITALLDSEWTT